MRAATIALLAFLATAASAAAGVPTPPECREGAEFVANAARARDNGMAREVFLARMEEDFVMLRALPPAMRWFARDGDDERFLVDAVARAFDRPQPPMHHHAEFLAVCLERSAAQAAGPRTLRAGLRR